MPTSGKKKIRIDQLLVEKGLAPSRTRAQSLIMSGSVFRGTQRIDKTSELFSPEDTFIIKGQDHPFVSRGGLKLQGALDHFKTDVRDKICLDVGVSTGGFTDCLLKYGAKKVYGVDVGYGQIDWKLRQDSRVILFERTNFRNFDISLIKDFIDIAVVDVSFISLTKIIPKILELPYKKLDIICLIKPQFEVGKEKVGKGGIVKEEKFRLEAVEKIKNLFMQENLDIKEIIPSPIFGQDGNQEFLITATSYRKD